MAYLTATRYGLTKIPTPEPMGQYGWEQFWSHPSGIMAMRHPDLDGWRLCHCGERGYELIGEITHYSSSLRAVSRRIERIHNTLT